MPRKPHPSAGPTMSNIILFVVGCALAAVNPIAGLFVGAVIALRLMNTPTMRAKSIVAQDKAQRRDLWGL